MDKKLLKINKNFKFDVFSYAEENLFIDLLIKADEESRQKAKEYAGYLENLKKYVEFKNENEVDEIIEFLKPKNEITVTQEEKREYMEMKFDILDGKNVNNNIFQQYFIKNFPLLSYLKENELNLYDNYLSFFSIYKEEVSTDNKIADIMKQKKYENIIDTIKKSSELNEINIEYKNHIVIPFIISYMNEQGLTGTCVKIIKFGHKNISNNLDKKNKIDLFKEFILLGENGRENISEKSLKDFIINKTNLFCDYRFFDREIFQL